MGGKKRMATNLILSSALLIAAGIALFLAVWYAFYISKKRVDARKLRMQKLKEQQQNQETIIN